MKIEFYLCDRRFGGSKILKAADPNGLVKIAEKLGLKNDIEKLGSCWKWKEGELLEFENYDKRIDVIYLRKNAKGRAVVWLEKNMNWIK